MVGMMRRVLRWIVKCSQRVSFPCWVGRLGIIHKGRVVFLHLILMLWPSLLCVFLPRRGDLYQFELFSPETRLRYPRSPPCRTSRYPLERPLLIGQPRNRRETPEVVGKGKKPWNPDDVAERIARAHPFRSQPIIDLCTPSEYSSPEYTPSSPFYTPCTPPTNPSMVSVDSPL